MEQKAYPPPEVKKKEKKVKNRGTKYPGAAAGDSVEAQPDGHIEGKEGVKDKLNVSSSAEAAMKSLDLNGSGAIG